MLARWTLLSGKCCYKTVKFPQILTIDTSKLVHVKTCAYSLVGLFRQHVLSLQQKSNCFILWFWFIYVANVLILMGCLCCFHYYFNSLAPGGLHCSLKLVNFKLISTTNCIFCEIVIRWVPRNLTDHLSTLVQAMAWCHRATSHYLSQCWPRSLRHMSLGHNELIKANIFSWCLNCKWKILIPHLCFLKPVQCLTHWRWGKWL